MSEQAARGNVGPAGGRVQSYEDLLRSGAWQILRERERQITVERWTPDHDAEHDEGDLLAAALCYATPATSRQFSYKVWAVTSKGSTPVPEGWPWDAKWWKPTPTDRVRELVKAGALIAAEIDRLLRAAHADSGDQP